MTWTPPILLPGGKALMNAGKFVANAEDCCCGAPADCSACAGDTISIVISYEGACSQAQCKDRLSPTTRTGSISAACVCEVYFYYGAMRIWMEGGRWWAKIWRTYEPLTGFGSGTGEEPMDVTAYVTCAGGSFTGAFTLIGYGDCAGCTAGVTIS